MIAWMFLNSLGARSIAFPEQPLTGQLTIGRRVYRSGAGIERTLSADKLTLGTWFDGRIRRSVDTVTWLSPELVSRWIGYLAERDGWSDEAITKRWVVTRDRLNRNLTFIVRLAAFPRLDPLEFGIGAPPKPESFHAVRFRLSYAPGQKGPGKAKEPMVSSIMGTCAASFEKEEPADVTGRPFFSLTEFAPLFLDEGEVDRPDDGIPLGDYYGAVYVASFPVMPEMRTTKCLDLTVQLTTKCEHAVFQTYEWPAPTKNRRSDDD